MSHFAALQEAVCQANLDLVKAGLVVLTWGNVSGADRDATESGGVMAIKPSGVAYDKLKPADIVVLEIATGKIVAGVGRPSSDTPTHRHLYQSFPTLGGIAHTHSVYGSSFAQAMRDIPCLGTTHSDNFYGAIPATRSMTDAEIQTDYELNTGRVIVECFEHRRLDPAQIPGVLVASHAPFAWGETAAKAVENAIVLEFAAQMALNSMLLNSEIKPVSRTLLDKHFLRKHGPRAYYGQPK
jgi:L-ribulose-5-phosphate 4-epimerase